MRDQSHVDPYGVDLSRATWTRPCGGNVGDQGDGCVETTELPGGGIAIRDSKRADLPALRFTAAEWRAFTQAS